MQDPQGGLRREIAWWVLALGSEPVTPQTGPPRPGTLPGGGRRPWKAEGV